MNEKVCLEPKPKETGNRRKKKTIFQFGMGEGLTGFLAGSVAIKVLPRLGFSPNFHLFANSIL
jgi:hypothetical protein